MSLGSFTWAPALPLSPERLAELGLTPTPPPNLPDSEAKPLTQTVPEDLAGMNQAQLAEVGNQMLSHLPKEERERIWAQAISMTEAKGNRNLTGEEVRRMDIANIRTILKDRGLINAQPQPAERDVEKAKSTGETGEISKLEAKLITWRHGKYVIEIEKGNVTWNISFYVDNKSVDFNNGALSESLNLADAIKDFQGIEPGTAEKIYQSLAKSFLDPNDKSISSVLSKYLPVDMHMLYSANDRRRFILNSNGTLGNPDNNESYTRDHLENPDIFGPRLADRLKSNVGKSLLEAWIKGSPAPTAPTEEEATHKPVIEEVAIEGNRKIIGLTVNGTDLSCIFVKQGQGHYTLDSGYNRADTLKDLDIPQGMEVYFDIKPNPSSASRFERISIIGGEGAKLNLKELFSLEILDRPVVGIFTTKYDDWASRERVSAGVGRGGQAVRHNLDANASVYAIPGLPIGTWMSMEKLEDYLKTRKEEISTEAVQKSIGEKPGITENIINMEGIGIEPASILEALNKLLGENKNESHLTVIFSPDQLKEYAITSLAGYKAQARRIEVDKHNQIIIKGIKFNLPRIGGTATFDLTIYNGAGDKIAASIENYGGGFKANRVRGRVENRIKTIDFIIRKKLAEETARDNPLWLTENISIADGKVLIRFEKLPEGETAKPRETLESQVPVQEPKVQVQVFPISGEDFDYVNRLVKLKIEGKESGIVWKERKDRRGEPIGRFDLEELRGEKGKLMLPNGTRLEIGKYISESNVSIYMVITGGRNIGINIPDLIYFKDHDVGITLQTNDSESWESTIYPSEESGKCIFVRSIAFSTEGEKITHGLSVKQAIALLKKSLEKAMA